MNSPFYKNLALWMVIGLIVIVLFNVFQASQPSKDKVVFSDFLKKIETGEVKEVVIRGKLVQGRLGDGSSFTVLFSTSSTRICPAFSQCSMPSST